MFSLTVAFGPGTGSWGFLFNEKAKADSIYDLLRHNDGPILVAIEDDYGQKALIQKTSVHGILLEDLAAAQEATIARSMINAKTQQKFNRMVQNDPLLKLAGGGPTVLNHPGAPRRQ